MPARQLLIVDGDSLRSPGMLKAFEDADWHLTWLTHLQLQVGFVPETSPDAILLSPMALSQTETVLGDIASHFPRAKVFACRKGSMPLPPSIDGVVDLDTPSVYWPAMLDNVRPTAGLDLSKALTTEDLFADIVADLHTGLTSGETAQPLMPEPKPQAVAPEKPPAPRKATPAVTPSRPATVPPKVAPVVPKVSLPQVPKLSVRGQSPASPAKPSSAPKVGLPLPLNPKPLPMPGAGSGPKTPKPEAPAESQPNPLDELRALFGGDTPPPHAAPTPLQVPEVSASPAPAGEDEYTLSGISGIHDPFDATPLVPQPAPEPAAPAAEAVTETGPGPITLSTDVPLPLPSPALRSTPVLDSQQMPVLDEFGNYYLLEKIAVGGMAELFKARQRGVHDFQKIVAIKRILPHLSDNDEFVRMFIDEAKLAAQLTHPNIVQIFDLGRVSGFYYIAMEFVDGRDLRSMMRKVREFQIPFPEQVAAFVIMKVAGALDYAHRKRGMDDRDLKLVHRDISPQNILLSNDGAVKLVDFGIAKAATKSTQTVAGALKGKLLYMSPEQALGQSLDHRSDIFSLGLVLFELLTGERCFQADSELGVLEKVRLGRVANIRTINPRVSSPMASILEKALEKDLTKRYAYARVMERDLKDLMIMQGGEPTEHDIAEFANTLLKGTREQLELLVANKFPVPVIDPRASQPRSLAIDLSPSPRPLAAPVPELNVAPRVPLPEPPPYDQPLVDESGRPRWLLPVIILAILGSVAYLLWRVLRT